MASSPVRESLPAKVSRRVRWAIRDRVGSRKVTREVQGVSLVLPWSHRLPDYAKLVPAYGQNLVQVAQALAAADGVAPTVLDIGANVGDSTAQILAAVPGARVLCVEADPFYLPFLDTNVGAHESVTIQRSLVVVGEADATMTPVRSGGTTRFEVADASAVPAISVAALREAHPTFDRLRLAKSDTDGFDVTLGPEVARVWADAPPVLFLEFDPRLSRVAGNDPAAAWTRLAELGYAHVAVWDHLGGELGLVPIAEAADRSTALDATPKAYWDIAVVHGDDAAGRAALETLVAPGWR